MIAAFDLVLKLTHNILKAPTESKFRTIRSTIPKIQKTLFNLPTAGAILIDLGFTQVDAEHYTFIGDYFKVLKKGQVLIEKAMWPLKYKYMSKEDKAKHDALQAEKRAFLEQKQKRRELMEEAKRL